jgi:N utilization substance protein B
MKRRLAREIALQALYQMEMNEVSATEGIRVAVEEAEADNEAKLSLDNKEKIDPKYVQELVDGTKQHLTAIDDLLLDYLKGWAIDRLSRVDRQILRIAVYEMVYREDVPPRVVVNEAIELAKHFGAEESGKFVNGVLGKMIKVLEELKAKGLSQS